MKDYSLYPIPIISYPYYLLLSYPCIPVQFDSLIRITFNLAIKHITLKKDTSQQIKKYIDRIFRQHIREKHITA